MELTESDLQSRDTFVIVRIVPGRRTPSGAAVGSARFGKIAFGHATCVRSRRYNIQNPASASGWGCGVEEEIENRDGRSRQQWYRRSVRSVGPEESYLLLLRCEVHLSRERTDEMNIFFTSTLRLLRPRTKQERKSLTKACVIFLS